MTRERCHPACSAFSLLEVLVVSAMIALLLAVLVPGLSAARQQTRRTLCAANLDQLATAWHHYLNENKGFFHQDPWAELNYGGKQGAGATQFGKDPRFPKSKPINRHLGLPPVTRDRAEVFQCPCDTGAPYALPTAHEYFGTSYRANPMLVSTSSLGKRNNDPCLNSVVTPFNKRLGSLNRSELANESRLLLLGDMGWENMWDYTKRDVVSWHQRKAFYNLAFMDAHVRFTRIRKGVSVSSDYVIVPYRDLQAAAGTCQQEVPLENW